MNKIKLKDTSYKKGVNFNKSIDNKSTDNVNPELYDNLDDIYFDAKEQKISKYPTELYKTIKVPLKHIIRNEQIFTDKINTMVKSVNKIVYQCLMFMKLYILYCYDNNDTLPTLDRLFINSCLKIQCNATNQGRPPNNDTVIMKNKLLKFYKEHYKNSNEKINYTGMSQIFEYITNDIITMYENNIKQHYITYIGRFINVILKKDDTIKKYKENITDTTEQQTAINAFTYQLRKIKNDIINITNDPFTSNLEYHNIIKKYKPYIIPNKTLFEKDSIYYDIAVKPQDYLPCMIYMMKIVEEYSVSIYNVFPTRTKVIPSHIPIDTTTLVYLLLTKKQGKKDDYVRNGNLKAKEDKIWSFFFKTDMKCFHKQYYSFDHRIMTDGISCCILLKRKDIIDINKKISTTTQSELTNYQSNIYIDELTNYDSIKNKKIIGIDPGKCDLIYCVNGDTKNADTFHYSQSQRKFETKKTKYNEIRETLKKEYDYKIKEKNLKRMKYTQKDIDYINNINNKTSQQEKNILQKIKNDIEKNTIQAIETELSKFNHKTLDINKYKLYIQKINEVNKHLLKYYEYYLFRKLKLNGYINTKNSEQNMINNFKRVLKCTPENSIICIGDYEQKNHMKYKEPVKGVGMRRLFKQNGFKVLLVDEFRTSCMCFKCGEKLGRCEKFKKCKNWKFKNDTKKQKLKDNPKKIKIKLKDEYKQKRIELKTISNNDDIQYPKKADIPEEILCHGLLKCKTCNSVWNRDCNGASNIYRIANKIINGLARPNYLSRGTPKEDNVKKLNIKLKETNIPINIH